MESYIKSYEPSDAASIAQMWNESDEGWPGGFTGGVPVTEERVRQWLSEDKPIDVFLVVADNRVVAYCSLYEYAAEPSAAYVSLLNCHPRYWGRGFGRDLLRRAVARSTELGYKRLDLHTWPGNLRAVPLYKKTGFFWQPETSVHMLNFLPLILPVAQDFFADTDWYAVYERDLAVREDDITWQGMKVYPYTFKRNGHVLKAIVDRESRGLTAFENDDFSVACLLESQNLVAGMTWPVRWEIVNKGTSPLSVSLLASGEAGLHVYQQATIEVNDSAVITGHVMVDRDIEARGKEEAAHKITSTLVVGGRLLVLETGVRPKQALEITADPPYVSLSPGLLQPVHWRIKSNLKQPTHADVILVAESGLVIEDTQHSLELPAEGRGAISCTMRAEAGTPVARAIMTARTEQDAVSVKPVRLPIAAPGQGKLAAYLRHDELVVENDWLRLVVKYKAAEATFYRRDDHMWLLFQRAALGPPFYPNEFRGMHFRASVEMSDGTVTAVLSADSRQHPGLTLERIFRLDRSPLVYVGHRLRNTASRPYELNLRTVHYSQFGETSLALPTANGTVVDLAPAFPDWTDVEGRRPENMAEGWLSLNGEGFAVGIIWEKCSAVEMDAWTRLELTVPLPPLPAYGSIESPPVYVYAGPGTWHDVRRAWRHLVQPAADGRAPRPRRALQAATTPSPLLLLSSRAETTIRLDNQRSRPLEGSITLRSPRGWTLSPQTADFTALKRGSPVMIPLAVRRRSRTCVGAAEASLTVRHQFGEETFPVPLIALGRRGRVHLEETQKAGLRVVRVDNGRMRLTVAPDFVGAMVALECNGVNHLFTSFPAARAFSWLNPWHGGISPVVLAPEDDDAGPGNPGRMYEEAFGYELVRPRRGASIPWTGVRVHSDLHRERFRGLRLEVDYLTVAASNLVAVITRLVNTTGAPYNAVLMTQAYLQPGGEREKGILYDLSGRTLSRLSSHIWSAACGEWAAIANSEKGTCVAMVAGAGSDKIVAIDYGLDGAHLYNTSLPVIAPRASYEMVSYIVLTADVTEAKAYRWLECVPWP